MQSRRIYLAGTMQGSEAASIVSQDYRTRLKALFGSYLPSWTVVCPYDLHPSGLTYNDLDSAKALHDQIQAASACDLIVAYLPSASMGTAIELWESKKAGAKAFVISPLHKSWVIRSLADRVFTSLDEFEGWLMKHDTSRLRASFPDV